jgi:hypothetical protein
LRYVYFLVFVLHLAAAYFFLKMLSVISWTLLYILTLCFVYDNCLCQLSISFPDFTVWFELYHKQICHLCFR